MDEFYFLEESINVIVFSLQNRSGKDYLLEV